MKKGISFEEFSFSFLSFVEYRFQKLAPEMKWKESKENQMQFTNC